jgi:hypothetical protein
VYKSTCISCGEHQRAGVPATHDCDECWDLRHIRRPESCLEVEGVLYYFAGPGGRATDEAADTLTAAGGGPAVRRLAAVRLDELTVAIGREYRFIHQVGLTSVFCPRRGIGAGVWRPTRGVLSTTGHCQADCMHSVVFVAVRGATVLDRARNRQEYPRAILSLETRQKHCRVCEAVTADIACLGDPLADTVPGALCTSPSFASLARAPYRGEATAQGISCCAAAARDR